jgi:DEAD/DEAH box helicase domain-containing protein
MRTERRPWDDVLALGLEGPSPRLAHVEHVPAREARTEPLPADLDPVLWSALVGLGIVEVYTHQAEVFRRSLAGAHVGVVTGTASGKTLAYALPILQRLVADPRARALYLAPTKALAQDQARALRGLGLTRVLTPALYDGDTPQGARAVARRHANLLLTNPDMLHVGICPRHERFGDVLASLTHVVVDEAHVYRGVFGSHVANVLRRLRRLCATLGAEPQFLLASATVANPADAMSELVGAPVEVVADDGAPRAARTVGLWNPTLLDAATGERASTLAETAALVAYLVLAGLHVIAFARSRRAVELVHRIARDTIAASDPSLRDAIAPYRAGYTAEQRRELERRLKDGELRAVVATNALELGIDIGRLDVSVAMGFPGTVSSLLQQWGRAGRASDGLALLVASADALDQFFVRHPEALLHRPVEAAILDHASPEIRRAHLACAAFEAPLVEADDAILGDGAYREALALCEEGVLRATPAGLVHAAATFPAAAVALRSSSRDAIAIVDEASGVVHGTVERGRAFSTVHEGAVYLHLGEAYLVRGLDLEARVARVEPFAEDWYTQARTAAETAIVHVREERSALGVPLAFGDVTVTEQVLGYQRKRLPGHDVIDATDLDLPPETFRTQALWFTVPAALSGDGEDLLGTLHAAEHALISVLPLHAMCDRWDIGGLSTNLHPATGRPTIFVYDGHPGGVGIARHGYRRFAELVAHARDVIRDCPCSDGCPSCVQSPKCGNLNEPLEKDGALALLSRLTALGG